MDVGCSRGETLGKVRHRMKTRIGLIHAAQELVNDIEDRLEYLANAATSKLDYESVDILEGVVEDARAALKGLIMS